MRNRGLWQGYDGRNKPPSGWELNPDHPSSVGLVRMLAFTEGAGSAVADLASGYGLSTSNGPRWSEDGYGYGPLLTYNGSSQQATGTDDGLPSGTSPVTMAVLFRGTTSASNQCLLGYGKTSTSNNNFHLLMQSGLFKVGAASADLVGTAVINDGKWHMGVGIFSGGNIWSYVDGKPDLAPNSVPSNTTVLIGAGGVYSGKLGAFNIWTAGDVAAGWIWNRALSAGEVAAHYDTPFATLRTVPRRKAAGPSLAAYALTASPGAFSLAGNAANLLVARKISVAVGSVALTGIAANLRAARLLPAAKGAFVETGNAANLIASRKLTASAGSIALTGRSAGLLATRKLTASSGSVAITGNAAGLLATRRLTASAGSLALTGNAASLLASRKLIASAGAFTLTGNAANLVYTATTSSRVSLEIALGAYLAADPAIAAKAGVRVYFGRIPQGVGKTTPVLTFRVISRRTQTTLDGDGGMTFARVQIDATGADQPEAESLAFAARSAMNRIPRDCHGITVAAAYIDDGGGCQDDTIQSGTDSTRQRQSIDAFVHYYETLT